MSLAQRAVGAEVANASREDAAFAEAVTVRHLAPQHDGAANRRHEQRAKAVQAAHLVHLSVDRGALAADLAGPATDGVEAGRLVFHASQQTGFEGHC